MAKSKQEATIAAQPDIRMIAVSKLVLCPKNVRKTPTTDAENAELYASIKEIGLKQNLLVHPVGAKFHVHAGGRRLYTLQQLIKDKHFKSNHQIQCVIETEDQAEETSAAENMVRAAMHPADQFEAFASLRKKGQSEKDIATKFGITVKLVHQRLKLADITPEILTAFRKDKLTLNCVMAFTLSKDHSRQSEVWQNVSQSGHVSEYTIRQKLTAHSYSGNSRLAKFVGLAVYKKAGGTVLEDLFSDDATVHLEDSELVDRLASEKLEALAKDAAKTWKWAEASIDANYDTYRSYGRVYPKPVDVDPKLETEMETMHEQLRASEAEYYNDTEAWTDELEAKEQKIIERINKIEKQILDSTVYSDENHKLAGCIISVDYDGNEKLEAGLVKPEDIPAQQSVTGEGEISGNENSVSSSIELPSTLGARSHALDPAIAARKEQGVSQSLADDLRATRHQIVKAHLAADTETAYDVMLYAMCRSVFSIGVSQSPLQVSLQHADTYRSNDLLLETIAERMLEAINEGLNLTWMEIASPDDFYTMTQLKKREKEALFAWCTAHALRQQLSTDTYQNEILEHLGSRLQVDVAACWRPTAENYWGRVKKAHALNMAKELIGDRWSDDRASLRKPEIAKAMEQAFSEDAQEASGLKSEIVEHTIRWLPEGMGFGGVDVAALPVASKSDVQCETSRTKEPSDLPEFMNAAA